MKTVSRSELITLIKGVGHKVTIIAQGPHGSSKTSVSYDLARDPDLSGHLHMTPIDCTQLTEGDIGLPSLNTEMGTSRWLPNEKFGVSNTNRKGVNNSHPVVITLDEVFKIKQYQKDAIAPIVYERRIGSTHFPDGSIVTGFTNLALEGLGDSVQPHFKDRVMIVTMRPPNALEWINEYAYPNSVNAVVIAFVSENHDVAHTFLDYESGGQFEGKDQEKLNPGIYNPRKVQSKWATLRSLTACGHLLDAADCGGISDGALNAGIEGLVGEATAEKLSAYVRFGQQMPRYSDVVAAPKTIPVPTNQIVQMVQVHQFIGRTQDRTEATAVVQYIDRMAAEMQTIFCNSVANSTKIATFSVAAGFGSLMAKNKVFFNV